MAHGAAVYGGGQGAVETAGAAESHRPGHHGHTIISGGTLLAVLLTLLFFTLLTVGATWAEATISATFGVVLPQWVNVLVALSIAVVKTTLVVMFFMGLRYDNPINAMVFVFTLVTAAIFLGFTMLDLGTRGTIDTFKARYITPGGTGLEGAGPITKTAREAAIAANSPYVHDLHEGEHHGAGPRMETHVGVPGGSSEEWSRPVKGLTLPGFAGEQVERAGDGEHGGAREH